MKEKGSVTGTKEGDQRSSKGPQSYLHGYDTLLNSALERDRGSESEPLGSCVTSIWLGNHSITNFTICISHQILSGRSDA
jgi:hypothetical protein